ELGIFLPPGEFEGGFVVSEECGDVKVFSSTHKLVCSVGSKYNHYFGNPAGVCVDREGNLIVADEQQRKVYLFPPSGSPICLVSKGLQRPMGIACSPQGLLFVADNRENCVKKKMKEMVTGINHPEEVLKKG
uniref:NHLC4 protein n=1 Tax=Varanus komodoensis TaxID=61221 RepID=A0A8D2L4F1_VARKO